MTSDAGANAVLITVAVATAFLALVFATPFVLLIGGAFCGYVLYRDNPKRKERIAREHTIELYNRATQALIGTAPDVRYELNWHLPGNLPARTREELIDIGEELFKRENIPTDIPPPPAVCNSIEGARYRDMIARMGQARADPKMTKQAAHKISEALAEIAVFVPRTEGELYIPITACIDNLNELVDRIIVTFFEDNDYNHFKELKDVLNRNFNSTHRTNPVYPTEYKGDDVVDRYLRGTPLARLFEIKVPFSIPERLRFEHTHIAGGTGSGKTTTIKYLIAKDLEDVAAGNKSVIVIDSQSDLINDILRVDFPLERVVWINPEDIEWPVCLNLFSIGQARYRQYDALAREQLRNSIIELYEFVLASLMDTGLSGQQRVIFRYVTRLMLEIPDATLLTFVDVLEEGGKQRYQQYIDRLEGVAARFFESQFDDNEFKRMRKAVLRRLYLVLENSTFERMFRNPESKLDLFTEINAGKLILINTSKATLKEDGTKVFGRFFIALLAQAAAERAMIPADERIPTICYIDECHEYLDQNVNVILAQARKQNIGLVMAHQFLGQLSADLRGAFEANTSIKLAGSVSASDAAVFARQMGCDASEVQNAPTFHFMTYVRSVTRRAVPIAYPPGILERLPRRYDREALLAHTRATYCAPLAATRPKPEPEEAEIKGEGFTMKPDPKDDFEPL